jgi:DNA-binding transcriptional ArsR family regulator
VKRKALIFAALGDATRLSLLLKLCGGAALSITQLAEDSKLTRQAITKHLRVLEDVGLVRGKKSGRESLFELEPEPLDEARGVLDLISKQWDDALARLKAFVEE